MKKIKQYLYNLLYALDTDSNAVLGGDPRETISSRLGKVVKEKDSAWAYYACRVLSWFDHAHCMGAINKRVGDMAVWRWK